MAESPRVSQELDKILVCPETGAPAAVQESQDEGQNLSSVSSTSSNGTPPAVPILAQFHKDFVGWLVSSFLTENVQDEN